MPSACKFIMIVLVKFVTAAVEITPGISEGVKITNMKQKVLIKEKVKKIILSNMSLSSPVFIKSRMEFQSFFFFSSHIKSITTNLHHISYLRVPFFFFSSRAFPLLGADRLVAYKVFDFQNFELKLSLIN